MSTATGPRTYYGTDWLNARWFGATGDGGSDDTQALHDMLNAASPGQVAYLPTAVAYCVSAPLTVPTGVTLRGPGGNANSGTTYPAVIQTLPTWSASGAATAAVIIPGGDEAKITNLNIDCDGIPSVAAGIAAASAVNNVTLRDVWIRHATGHGVDDGVGTGGPGTAWRLTRVNVSASYEIGFNLGASDSDYVACIAAGCSGHGWYLNTAQNNKLIGCRAEWSVNGYGYYIGGSSTQTGGIQLVGCSTDRNSQHGVYCNGTGNFPILISGMQLRRDGAGSTTAGYAGIAVAATCTSPVIIDGVTTFPGYNDNGTGNLSPEYGISVAAGATYVAASNAFLHGATAGTNGTITNFRAVATRTGAWSSPSAITQVADSA